MFKLLKKYFVSQRENDYKPHVFRNASTLSIFFVVIAIFFVAISGRVMVGSDFTALILPKVLVDYANQDRDASNYNHLVISTTLEKAAQLKANDMAEKGYFAHNSPDGRNPWYWFKQVGYDFSFAGENLAVNFSDSVDVNTAWMASAGHRDNIMNSNFSEIGIATAEGFYEGRRTTFVVQLFGRPSGLNTSSVKVKTILNNTKKAEVPTVVQSASSSAVLSESVSTETLNTNGTSDLYISVKNTNAPVLVPTLKVKYSSLFDKLCMSPKMSLILIYFVISIIVTAGLISMIFVEIKKHHFRMIFVGIGLLIVMIGLLFIYKNLLYSPLLIL